MRLNHLTLENYRLFKSVTIDFHDRLTVLVGDNGVGKTSILEGAAVAVGTLFTKLDGIPGARIRKSDAHLKSFPLGSSDDVQPQYPVKISADGSIGGNQMRWTRSLNTPEGNMTVGEAKEVIAFSETLQQQLRTGEPSLSLPLIAYYGTGRLYDYHREKKTNIFKTNTRTNGYIDCLDGTANIKLMMSWFCKMTIQKYQQQEKNLGPVPELEAVYRALESCFVSATGFSDVDILYNLDTNELDVCYTDEYGMQMRIPLSQLSAGYKGTVSLIADIAYRMANLNPQLLDRVLEETEGIVLIDEIDLHLHPQWQKHILDDLTRIFPKVQFIVSTHAPTVINSVRSENLVILKDLQPQKAASQVYGKDVKSVLGEIMGVEERPEEVARLFEAFYQQLSAQDYATAEHTLDQLDELRDYHDAEVAGCRVKLKLERLRGGAI